MEPSSSRKGKVATELDIELSRKLAEIESILGYTFRNKSLLVEAITHDSCTDHPSYQRIESEFLGDAVLALVVSMYLYETYPDTGSDNLTALRHANISNEKLSRVAVRLGLYRFLRRHSPDLDQAVSEFTDLVTREEEEDDGRISYGGSIVEARTVLAGMVESIAAAIYWDCDSDLKLVWKIFSKILIPFITLETMEQHPMEARQVSLDDDDVDAGQHLYKQRLYVYCDKKRWMKPLYKIDKEEGPAHSKKFICSVTVGWSKDSRFSACGDPESRVKYAENSAARRMLSVLHRPVDD